MPRKRKRDWPQRVYKFAVVEATVIPDAMWDQAKKMKALWDKLAEMHSALRESIKMNNPSEEERKAAWVQFNLDAVAVTKSAGLKQESEVDVLDRFTKACVAASKDASRGYPHPKPLSVSIRHRYSGGGVPVRTLMNPVSKRVRIQGNLSLSDSGLRHRNSAKKGGDGRNRHGIFQLNSGEHIEFVIQQHEPISPVAIIKSVRWAGQRTHAFGWQWFLIIQTEEPPVERDETGLSCGIDFGWRKRGNSLRVAYLAGSDGDHYEVLLPLDFSTRDSRRRRKLHPHWNQIPESHRELSDLQSRRDGMLEDLKVELCGLLSPLPAGFDKMRSRGLIRLIHDLPDADSVARRKIEEWLLRDRPLFRMQFRASERFANKRKDLYRNIAAKIAEKYDIIRIEDAVISGMISDKGRTEDRDPALKAADRYHQIAAPGDFLLCIQSAAKKRGAKVVKHEAMHTSDRCSRCDGGMSTGSDVEQTCENGHSLDQDLNAALNLLSQKTPVSVRKPKSRKELANMKPQSQADVEVIDP